MANLNGQRNFCCVIDLRLYYSLTPWSGRNVLAKLWSSIAGFTCCCTDYMTTFETSEGWDCAQGLWDASSNGRRDACLSTFKCVSSTSLFHFWDHLFRGVASQTEDQSPAEYLLKLKLLTLSHVNSDCWPPAVHPCYKCTNQLQAGKCKPSLSLGSRTLP